MYKSICLPGKVNNGLLNDLFQVYVYSPVFSHDVFKTPSFAIFIPHPRSPFYEQLQLWQNVCRPTQYKTKHLSLVLSKQRKYRGVSQLSLPVLFCVLFIEQCYTRLLTTPQGTIMWSDEWSCKLGCVDFTWGIFEFENNWNENWKELSQADNWWGNKYEIYYTQFCLLACVGCVQVFVKQDGDVYLMFDTSP